MGMAVVILVLVLVALVGLLAALLLTGKPKSCGRADVEVQTGIEVESSRLATRSGHIEQQDVHRQTVITDDGRMVWQIVLENEQGVRRSKCFCGHLLLGRARHGAEPAGMLYLDGDETVSKQQCEILALPADGLVLQNRSRASMTMVDGRPAAEPVSLRPGSVLEMGRSVWRILVIRAR